MIFKLWKKLVYEENNEKNEVKFKWKTLFLIFKYFSIILDNVINWILLLLIFTGLK